MAKAKRLAKRKSLNRTDRFQVECIVSSGKRAQTLLRETWHRAEDLPAVMVSAILRDLLIEVGHMNHAGNNLAERLIGGNHDHQN